jgi:hypothetical protein
MTAVEQTDAADEAGASDGASPLICVLGIPRGLEQMRTLAGSLLVLALLASPARSSVTVGGLPATVREALSKPSRVELLSLEPGRPRGKPKRSFHGWKVLGGTLVVDREKQNVLLSAVDRGIAESDGSVAVCFEPRHGITVTSGSTVVDLVICFECLQVEAFVNGKAVEGAPTTSMPQPILDKLLEEAGVPLGLRSER